MYYRDIHPKRRKYKLKTIQFLSKSSKRTLGQKINRETKKKC